MLHAAKKDPLAGMCCYLLGDGRVYLGCWSVFTTYHGEMHKCRNEMNTAAELKFLYHFRPVTGYDDMISGNGGEGAYYYQLFVVAPP